MQETWKNITSWVMNSGLKIIIALIVLFIACKVINGLMKKLEKKLLGNGKLDRTLVSTLCYVGKIGLKILVVIALIGYVGIDTSGFAALLASLGVCFGLAVNGALSNLAGGFLILISRPFSVGDYIEAQGYQGVVTDIKILNTKILTIDNKVVHLPNGSLSAGNIVNYSSEKLRRIDIDFTVGGNDPEEVCRLILDACKANALIKNDPEPFARVSDYGTGNGVIVTMRAWVDSPAYWDGYFSIIDDVRHTFDEHQIVIPFNQLDVHVKND